METCAHLHVDNHLSLPVHWPSIEESVERWNAEHVTQEPVRLLYNTEQEFYQLDLLSGKEITYVHSSGVCRTSCEVGRSKRNSSGVKDSDESILEITCTTYKHTLLRRSIATGKHDILRFRNTDLEMSIEEPTLYRSKKREALVDDCSDHEVQKTNYTSAHVSRIVCTSNGAVFDNKKNEIISPFIDTSHDCVVWCSMMIQTFENTGIDKNSDYDSDQIALNAVHSLRIIPVHASHSTVALQNTPIASYVNASTLPKCIDSIIVIHPKQQQLSENGTTDAKQKENMLRIAFHSIQNKEDAISSFHSATVSFSAKKTESFKQDTSHEEELREEEEQETTKHEELKYEELEEEEETLESPLYELPSISGRTFSGTDQRSEEQNNTSTNKSGDDNYVNNNNNSHSPWAVVSPHLITEQTVASFFDDNFEPIQVLGKGASGAALLVRHHSTGFLYAVKVFIARDYDSERHILQETRLHAFLQHRHLVRYHVSWSEVVTRKRAQELAQIGLCHPEEAEVMPIQYKSEESSQLSSFHSNSNSTESECSNYKKKNTTNNNKSSNNDTRENEMESNLPYTMKMEVNCRPRHKSIIGSRVIFLQMELCQRTLKSYLEERSNVDRVENMVIFLQIVSGVRYMHRMHLVHRDIKANNIFLDYRCQLAPANTLRADDESDDHDDDDNVFRNIKSPNIIINNSSGNRSNNLNTNNNDNDDNVETEFYDKENNEKQESTLPVEEKWPLTTFCIAHEGANQPRWQIGPSLMSYGRNCIHLSTKSPFTHIATQNNNINSYKVGGGNGVNSNDEDNRNTLLDTCDNIHHCSANDVIREAISMYATPHGHSNVNKTGQGVVLHDNSESCENYESSSDELNTVLNKLLLDESKWSRVLRWVQRRLVQVRIGDFGLSKFLTYNQHSVLQSEKIENCESDSSESSDSINHVNTKGVGTPLYASPEQLTGMMCTPASDVFSLGVLFTEMYIEPTTLSERIVLLQRVRQGTFPDSAMLARYPELAIVPQLTRLCPQERMTLDKVHVILYNILLECIKMEVHKGAL